MPMSWMKTRRRRGRKTRRSNYSSDSAITFIATVPANVMNRGSNSIGAMRKSDNDADRILTERDDTLRQRMVDLFQTKVKPQDIVTQLEDEGALRFDPSVTVQTKAGVVRRVVAVLLDPHKHKEIKNGRYAQHLQSVAGLAGAARDNRMKELDLHVWSPDEERFFKELIERTDMHRTLERLNHPKIAAAMYERFGDGYFTADTCRTHNIAIRNKAGQAERQRRRRRLRREQGMQSTS